MGTLGEKIILFDDIEYKTAARFRSLFGINLDVDSMTRVEIGEPMPGNMREVFVGNETRLIDLSMKDEMFDTLTNKVVRVMKQTENAQIVYKKSTNVFTFEVNGVEKVIIGSRGLAEFLGYNESYILKNFKKGIDEVELKGYNIKRTKYGDL